MRTTLWLLMLLVLPGLTHTSGAQCVTSLVAAQSCTPPGGTTTITDAGGGNTNVVVVGGTFRYTGTAGISSLNMAGGTLYYASNGPLNGANISGGRIIFSGTGSASGITQSGGTLQVCGGGQLSLTGNLNAGEVVVVAGGQLTFPNTYTLQNSARLTNYGTTIFQNTLTVASGSTGVLVNVGTLTASGQVNLNGPGFVNQGTASFGTLSVGGNGRACLSPYAFLNVGTFQTNDNTNSITVSPASERPACVRVAGYGNYNAIVVTAVPSNVVICRAGTASAAELARYGTVREVRQNCTSCAAILPVELVAFDAQRTGPATVQLRWRTAQELRNRGFDVEKSADGHQWQRVGFVAGAGTSTRPRTYAYTEAGTGAAYYRLAQYDEGAGQPTYSPLQYVPAAVDQVALAVYPNPAQGTARLLAPAGQPVQLLTAQGGLVRRYPVGATELDLYGLPAGLYLLRCGPQASRLAVE